VAEGQVPPDLTGDIIVVSRAGGSHQFCQIASDPNARPGSSPATPRPAPCQHGKAVGTM
jgi:hypothetical protein